MLNRGQIIDNSYQIIGEIGKGGGGIIYKAIHLRLNKYVVLKKIRDQVIGRIDVRREADILKNLKHSYLPQVYDFLQIDQQIFTIIDYIPGQSMDYFLEQGYQFQQKDILKWLKQLCEALEYLHSQNPPIIHSDIKPANIMITPEQDICLIDFNISLNSDKAIGLSGMSRTYAAKEQAMMAVTSGADHLDSAGILDARTDIYSLGATFYHVLTGVKPERGRPDFLPLHAYDLDYSESLIRILMKAMQDEKKKRYASAAGMKRDLEHIHKLDRRYRRQRRWEAVSTIIGVALICLSISVSYLGSQRMKEESLRQYDDFIRSGKAYVAEQDYEKAKASFDKAIGTDREKLAGYYEKLYVLSKQEAYEQVITLGSSVLADRNLQEELDVKRSTCADIEYMVANAYFKQEKFKVSLEHYAAALEMDDSNPDYFRDYAIALARAGEREMASDILQQAKKLGLEEVEILLAEAELSLITEQYEEAAERFREVLLMTSDEYVKKRAYVQGAQAMQELGDAAGEIAFLEEGRRETAADEVIQALAEAYVRMAKQDVAEADQYNNKALECYQLLTEQGHASLNMKLNLAVLYQSLGEYGEAEVILEQLLDEYASDYRIPMRYALLICDRQTELDVSRRDYREAEHYYNQAQTLYRSEQVDGKSDPEMQMLEELMEELYKENWLS